MKRKRKQDQVRLTPDEIRTSSLSGQQTLTLNGVFEYYSYLNSAERNTVIEYMRGKNLTFWQLLHWIEKFLRNHDWYSNTEVEHVIQYWATNPILRKSLRCWVNRQKTAQDDLVKDLEVIYNQILTKEYLENVENEEEYQEFIVENPEYQFPFVNLTEKLKYRQIHLALDLHVCANLDKIRKDSVLNSRYKSLFL